MSKKLKGRVLLLNASFEPLGTVGVARAIRLTMRTENPVFVEEETGRFLTTGKGEKVPIPSVLRLKIYVDIRKKIRGKKTNRQRIYIRDKFRCAYCSKKFDRSQLTLDHIVPKSHGGRNRPENLVTSCKPCNTKKADRTPDQARMPLATRIHEKIDIGTDRLLLCHYAESRPEWKKYLFMDD